MLAVRLMQEVAPAALKTWVSPAFWKAKVVLAALVALMALVTLTTRVALTVLMARVALVSWAARESRKQRDQQPQMLPVWHRQHMLQGQVEMQQHRLSDQETHRPSCILSIEPLRPGGQGMGQGHPTRPGSFGDRVHVSLGETKNGSRDGNLGQPSGRGSRHVRRLEVGKQARSIWEGVDRMT